MTPQQELLQEALDQAREGLQVAQVEEARLESVLAESDRDFQESVDRLSKVGL
jgi:hypothetical protein